MDENENKETNVNSTINAVAGLVAAIPVYQDAVQPAAKQIGSALETVTKTVNIALAPIKFLVWGYETIEGFISIKVTEKLKNVPPENIVSPPTSVAGPAIEALRFCGEENEVRELYANLLAAAMDSSTQDLVHPGYVEILKNLCSDEALLLQSFLDKKSYPLLNIRAEFDNGGTKMIYNNYSHFDRITKLKNKKLTPTYIDNLNRLGITTIPEDVWLHDEGIYKPLENDKSMAVFKKGIENFNAKMKLEKRYIKLTNFGKHFVENVVKEKE
ncbi:protein of unknown function [Flavobacterium flevense]|uniref:DUF4393 domain-containing protein n=1 Tax=Flavobacterium flevense TaxID=983 RepID=A0A4Y4AXE2_9FLAO|nr:DUF4393 domain-containing protein [Flavobacterium flevense]GEC71959.1 hypothetical protein FFL01_14980 [Flavobacterium flevense]SHL45920.1 protein of unknown function [Flavobacterium flevense]